MKKRVRTPEDLRHVCLWSIPEGGMMVGRSTAYMYAKIKEGRIPTYGDPMMLDPDETVAAAKAGFPLLDERVA
jgi:hypothetical protein